MTSLAERFSSLAASAAPGSRTARLVDAVSRAHARAYRASGGRLGASMGGAAVALLTTTGRRSGQLRSATVGCLLLGDREDGDVVVVASNAGRAAHPAWYLNLVDEPRAAVRVGRGERPATARTATGAERERLWAAVVAAAPVMADYQRRTSRELPVVVLTRTTQPGTPSPRAPRSAALRP